MTITRVVAQAHQRDKLERLCRYVSRPTISEKRLSLTSNGRVRYDVNGFTNAASAGRTEAAIAKLAALIPKPRVNLTRFHDVFAPNSKHRIEVTPAKRGKKRKKTPSSNIDWLDKTPEERHQAMTWMQRLKRVFNIDIEVCEHCGGQVKVIASIEDPTVIEHILKHLKQKAANSDTTHRHTLPPERAPPQGDLFELSQTHLFN